MSIEPWRGWGLVYSLATLVVAVGWFWVLASGWDSLSTAVDVIWLVANAGLAVTMVIGLLRDAIRRRRR